MRSFIYRLNDDDMNDDNMNDDDMNDNNNNMNKMNDNNEMVKTTSTIKKSSSDSSNSNSNKIIVPRSYYNLSYIITVVSCILVFLPLYKGFNTFDSDTNKALRESTVLLVTCSVALSLTFYNTIDVIMDIIRFGLHNSDETLFIEQRIIYLATSLSFPLLYFIGKLCNYEYFTQFLVCSIAVQFVLMASSQLILMLWLSTSLKHFHHVYLAALVVTFTVYCLSRCLYAFHTISPNTFTAARTLSQICTLLYVLLVIYKVRQNIAKRSLTDLQFYVLGVIFAFFIIFAIGLEIFSVIYLRVTNFNMFGATWEYNYILRNWNVTLACNFTCFLSIRAGREHRSLVNVQIDNYKKFTRHISHEMRTPLNIAMTSVELLLSVDKSTDTKDAALADTRKKELYDALQESLETATSTLNDMLQLDKISNGKEVYNFEKVNVYEYTQSTMKLFLPEFRRKMIKFSASYCASLKKSTILIDKMKFAQVLRNLLSNALKFTPERGIISVELMPITESLSPGKGLWFNGQVSPESSQVFLQIKVTDNGAGLDPDFKNLLFTEVAQFDALRLQEGKGSGFGLLITKSIVTAHDGKISVHSDGLGKGSTFTLCIPLCEVGELLPNEKLLVMHPGISFSQSVDANVNERIDELPAASSKTVLVVDDSATNLKMTSMLIKRLGFNVITAQNGSIYHHITDLLTIPSSSPYHHHRHHYHYHHHHHHHHHHHYHHHHHQYSGKEACDIIMNNNSGDIESKVSNSSIDMIVMDNLMPVMVS